MTLVILLLILAITKQNKVYLFKTKQVIKSDEEKPLKKKPGVNTRKITTIAILISLSVVLSLFDRYLSNAIVALVPIIGVLIPTFKLGIANIVIIIIIYNYNFGTSCIAVVLKSVIVGLFSGYISLIIGFTGTILSFLVMFLLSRLMKKEKLIIFVSAIGGFIHSLGQIIAGFMVYGLITVNGTSTLNTLLIYSPLILLLGLATGCIVGLIGLKVNQIIHKNKLIKS